MSYTSEQHIWVKIKTIYLNSCKWFFKFLQDLVVKPCCDANMKIHMYFSILSEQVMLF